MIIDDYRAAIRAKGYSYATQKTYTHWLRKFLRFFALNNVWKIKDGEPFGSRRTPDQEFGDVEMDEEAFGEDSSFDTDLL